MAVDETMPTWTEAQLGTWLDEAVGRSGVPGASLAVRHGDAMVCAQSGVVDVTTQRAVERDSVFQIGSTTKVLTAAIVLQLVGDGALDLNGAVEDHLGEFEIGGINVGSVTVRQLLDHTSGLPGHHFADFGPGTDSIERYVASLSSQQMIHRPGAMFSYCNAGYVVAGRLAEIATGTNFADLIRTRIAEPLGLRSTTVNQADIAGHRLVRGHELEPDGTSTVAERQTTAWSLAPAGSLTLATATELADIGYALSCDTDSALTSPGARDLLTRPSVTLPCPYWGRRAQCLGWGHDTRGGTDVLRHGGATTGHSAMLLAIPDHHLVVALLTNSASGGQLLGEAEQWLLNTIGIPPPVEPPDPNHELTPDDMAALEGTYTDIWTTTTIERAADGLTLTRRIHPSSVSPEIDLPPTPLAAIGPRLLVPNNGLPLMFIGGDHADPNARVTHLHQISASRRTVP